MSSISMASIYVSNLINIRYKCYRGVTGIRNLTERWASEKFCADIENF